MPRRDWHSSGVLIVLACLAAPLAGCRSGSTVASAAMSSGPTTITILDQPLRTGVKHFGINLGGQNFYDSGQMMRNLVFINPGFEGETWQTILRCEGVSKTTCTDPDQWNQWPANFLQGAQFEFLSGTAEGITGTVLSSDAADKTQKDQGVTIHFQPLSKPFDLDDFVLLKKAMPGRAEAGWWTNAYGGATFATEFHDLASDTPGKQALKIIASGPGQAASVSSYFDSTAGHSFVQLAGTYRLTFRAEGAGGNSELRVTVERAIPGKSGIYLNKKILLNDKWHDYSFDFSAAEDGHAIGTAGLTFSVAGANVLLDDVTLQQVPLSQSNPTVFRNEVVQSLRSLSPGILRYQDGDHIGSSIDNLIAPPFARVRAGWSEGASEQTNIPMGLHEFLQLCQVVHAEPWFNVPAGISLGEARELVEYLAAPSTTPYGAKRAARGQTAPWTTVLPKIHLELGNEEWNAVTFAGAAMNDPEAYGRRAKDVFSAMRSSSYFDPKKFDLVLGSFALIPDMTRRELAASGSYDSVAVAPYMFNRFDDASSNEAIFGPMLAEPEMLDDTPQGFMVQQEKAASGAAHPATLSVYEVNLGADNGSVSQQAFDRTVPSMGAGLALIDHMLLILRDLGIKDQSLWELPGFQNVFQNSLTHQQERTPLFGAVVDMGGATNLRRPQFLAEQLVNEALLSTMLKTRVTGLNPAWDQPNSANDDVRIDQAHEIQSFAFADGPQRSLIVLNLSRTQAIPVVLSGEVPHGTVRMSRLEAGKITDTNEEEEKVRIVRGMWAYGETYTAPPFSLTVFEWSAGK